MKGSLKMINIMDMVDLFLQMEIIIQAVGKMGKDLDLKNLLKFLENLMQECGPTVSLFKNDYLYME